MGFIGRQPTPAPLTSSDITDGIISTAKLANDAGDNTKLDLSANYAFTGTVSGAGDPNLVLIKTITIADDTTVSFVNGSSSVVFDSTYKVYKVIGTSLNVRDQDAVEVGFKASTDGGSNYNVTKRIVGYKNNIGGSGDTNPSNTAYSSTDQTGLGVFCLDIDGDQAENTVDFEMNIYNPAKTSGYKGMRVLSTFRRSGGYGAMSDVSMLLATNSAINAFQIGLSASNIDTGFISLYGVKS